MHTCAHTHTPYGPWLVYLFLSQQWKFAFHTHTHTHMCKDKKMD